MSGVEPSPGPVARPRRMDIPLGRDPASIRRRIESLERLLERSIPVPGTKQAVGLDSVVGLIPVAGDVFGAAMGAYLVWEASLLGLPKWKLLRMAGNVAFDSAVGAIPFAGDVFDFVFRSNSRNLKMLKRHLDKHHPLIEQ
jgi:hypothetical protein